MSTTTVAGRSALLSALSSAKGGDTIVLKDGNYGNIKLTADYASTVTIRAEDRLDATINNLELFGVHNLTFDGIRFANGSNGNTGSRIVSIENDSQNIKIVNSEVTGRVDNIYEGHWGVYIRKSDHITLQNNNIHDVNVGVVAFGSTDLEVINNKIDYFAADAMKLGGVYSSKIVDNISYGHVFPSNGAHNDFIQFQGNASNVLVDGNVFLSNTTPWVQGLFFNDGTYNNITVENNIIYTGMIHGVWFESAASGINVRNNTLLNVPNQGHSQTKIKVPGGSSVSNNVISDNMGGSAGNNLVVQNSKPNDAFYVDNFYKNGSEGRGISLQDLTPVAGSLAQSKGAVTRLKELLGGATAAPEPSPSSPAPSPSPEPTPAPSNGEVEINAGGNAATGFAADAYFSGGNTFKTGAGIAGTGADAIYQTERWGNFDYAVGVKNGTYDVTLHFAEIYFGTAGQRLFDVRAENKLVLDDYDVFREAGGKNVALDKTIRVKVDDGKLNLAFDGVKNNAKLSGLEIAPASGAAPEAAPASGGGGGSSGGDTLAINAGGKAASGFAAEGGAFAGGSTFATGAGIAGTGADAVYQTERWGNFDYALAVKNGTYDVTLHFAEIYWNAGGKRVFDVRAENKLVLDDYDVFREAGGKNAAVEESFKVQVQDGRLNLDFIGEVDNAKLNGLEIASSDGFDFL